MAEPLDLSDPIAVLLTASRALRTARIEAATYGGLALAVYGAARETKDADLAIAGVDIEKTRAAFRDAGLDVKVAFERVRFGGNLVTRFTLLPDATQTGLNTVDLVEPRSQRFARLVLSRAIEGTLRNEPIRVVSPEDFVLLKALSTRDRDVEDARTVVAALGERCDASALRREAALLSSEIADHDVAGRLERCFLVSP